MNKLNSKARIRILLCLLEGNSIRSTSRIVGVSKTTVLKLLEDTGKACLKYHEENMKNLEIKTLQVDEIWSFIHTKKKNIKNHPEKGDSWTWTSICTETKVVPCWYVGDRTAGSADEFIKRLSRCITGKVQITSDGLRAYETAIAKYISHADYGMMIKHYTKREDGNNLTIIKSSVRGKPKISNLSTSYIERQNLNIRMGIRRFTRKTNAFSKKLENHAHALALYFYYYNFIRPHRSIKTTPANAMGIDEEKSIESILKLAG